MVLPTPFHQRGLALVSQILSSSPFFFSFSFSYRPLYWIGFSHRDRAFIIYTWYEPDTHLFSSQYETIFKIIMSTFISFVFFLFLANCLVPLIYISGKPFYNYLNCASLASKKLSNCGLCLCFYVYYRRR
jgi:hypothetical protein